MKFPIKEENKNIYLTKLNLKTSESKWINEMKIG